MRRSRPIIAMAAALLAGVARPAAAHPPVAVTALVKIDASGGVAISVHHDALAFALNDTSQNIADAPMQELLDAPEPVQADAFAEARERFESLTVLTADDERVRLEIVRSPDVMEVRAWLRDHPERRLPLKLDITANAQLPAGASALTLRFPDALGDAIVTFDLPGAEPVAFPLRAGETSPGIGVNVAPQGGPASASGGRARPAPPAVGPIDVAARYAVLGFTHIIPGGADHALFVLGLFLLSPRLKGVLWQITAFTIAHSVTLTLTTLHLVSVPAAVVEPVIAGSIAFVAVENLVAKKVHPWRPAVAFAFGLAHGMGFASALSEVGLPTGQLAAGLVAFNVGVEGGHLAVLSAAFLALGWCRNRPWYRRRVTIPLSLVIAAIALFWTLRRLA